MRTNPKKSSQQRGTQRSRSQKVAATKKVMAESPSIATPRRFVTRRSGIHGRGVFALQHIKRGERILEYKGRLITEEEADDRYPEDDAKPAHTFLFLIEGAMVIDGNFEGNSARWFNHACTPNCETEEDSGRVWISAIRDIEPGDEMSYDYNLVLDEPITKALLTRYRCLCGARKCRGSLLGSVTRA
jgi:uncharacterized protein